MHTWRLDLEYDGTAFSGWQRQPGQRTVQAAVEEALERLLGGERVAVVAAGRTDAGVHALGQVASFRCAAVRSPRAVREGLAALLPPDVSCLRALPAPPSFHAQRSATGKRYRYRILTRGPRPALDRDRAWHLRGGLDGEAMAVAARHLVGRHDFTSFRAAGCTAPHAVCSIGRLEVARRGDELRVEVVGDRFVRHMVRNIVGTLVEVGRGRRPPAWVGEVLGARDRRAAGRTAPARGLYLVEVDYPAGDALRVADPGAVR